MKLLIKHIFFALLFIFILVESSFAQYDATALEILNKMSTTYRKMGTFKAHFTYKLVNEEEDINEGFSGTIVVKKEKFKLFMGEQTIINNGETVWTYLKEENEVTVDNYEPEEGALTPSNIYDAYKKGYKYLFLEDKTIDNKEYHIVDLVPENKDLQYYKIRLQINKKLKLLKQWTIYDKAGNQYVYHIDKFFANANVTDAYFSFNKKSHPGVDVVDLR